MATFDTTAFVAAVRRHARAPTSGTAAPGWADSDILAVANEELRRSLTPKLMAERAEFFVAVKDTALVAGTDSYSLPTRGALGKLREVQLVSADGTVRNLRAGNPEELNGRDTTSNNGTPEFYYFRAQSLVLVPAPDATTYTTLRLHYFRRPNRLVTVAECMTITSVASAPTYAGSKPASILTSTPVDVVSGSEPFQSRSDDLTPSAVVASTSVSFSSAVSGAAVGDYICLAGEAPVLQLPSEFFDLLVLRTADAMLAPGTDTQAFQAVGVKLAEAEKAVSNALAGDRNEGEAHFIISTAWGD